MHSSQALSVTLWRIVLSIAVLIQTMPSASCRPFSIAPPERSAAAFVSPTALVPKTMSSSSSNRRVETLDNTIRKVNVPLWAIDPSANTFNNIDSNFLLATSGAAPMEVSDLQVVDNLQIQQLSPTTTIIVFVIGLIPFEFWRRIAVGASFGTGSDSVVIPSPFAEDENDLIMIGEDGNANSSRGRQTLDRGALTVAYILFAVAGGSVAIAVASVVMGPQASPPL